MIDRFKKIIVIGWQTHEILWLEAAMTLSREERYDAFRDIAEMSGRSFETVRVQSYWRAHQARKREAIEADIAARRARQERAAKALPPSQIVATRAQKMAGRSTYSPTTGMP